MNREEAKDILQLCRPGHIEDLDDPLFQEAFEKLEQDSELGVWFEEQQMLDETICAEMERIMPPPNLKISILHGMRERVAKSGESYENEDQSSEVAETVPTSENEDSEGSKILWFRPLIGIAAVLLFASLLMILSRDKSTEQFADKSLPTGESVAKLSTNVAGVPDLIQFLSQQIADFNKSKFDRRSEQVSELQSYLALYGMPNPSEIPQKLKASPTIGCVAFDYNGTQMSMICFKNGRVYHLITLNKAGLDKKKLLDCSPSETKIFECEKQAYKVWSGKDQIYILSVEGTEEDLPEFI